MTKRGIRRLVFLAVSLLVLGGLVGGAIVVKRQMTQRDLERAREQGLALHRAGEHGAAIPLLGRYIRAHQDDHEALLAFGLSRKEVEMPNARHIRGAISALRAAADLEPAHLPTLEALLDIYAQAGFLTELVDTADRVLRVDPSNEKALTLRAVALINLGRAEDAVAAAESLTAAHPDLLDGHLLLVSALSEAGRTPAEQAASFRAQEERFRDEPLYFERRSKMEWLADDLEASIASARSAAALPPASPVQAADLVEWLRALQGVVDESPTPPFAATDGPALGTLADDYFARAIEDDRIGPGLAIQAAIRAWWAGRAEEARAFAARVSPAQRGEIPDAAGWAALLGLAEPTQPQDTADAPSGVGASDEDWPRLLAAMTSVETGSAEDALASLEQILTTDPEMDALVRYTQGLAFERIGDLRAARDAFKDAAEAPRVSRDRAWRALGDVLTRLGQYDEAVNAYRAVRNRDTIPALEQADRTMSRIERTGDTAAAEAMLEIMLETEQQEPDNPGVRVRVARALLIAGRTAEGLARARSLIDLENRPDAIGLIELGRVVQRLDADLALELLASAGAEAQSPELVFAQALALGRAGRTADARAMLDTAIAERSGAESLPYRVALIQFLESFDRAATPPELRRLSDDFPDSAAAQMAVLSTISVWNDLDLARAAVARLREATGEAAQSWRLFDARITLASDPTGEELSKVALDLGELLRQSPDDYDALILAARTYRAIAEHTSTREADIAGNIERAAGFYARAVGPASRAFAFRPFIEMLLDHGRDSRANEVMDTFLATENLPMAVRGDRVVLLQRLRRWADAIDDLTRLADLGDRGALLPLADAHTRSGDPAAARRAIERFLGSEETTPTDLRQAAQSLATAEDIDGALALLARLPEESELGDRTRVIADFLMENRRPDLALDRFAEIARASGQARDWVRAVQAAYASQNSDAIAALLAEAKAALPDAPEIAALSGGTRTARLSQLVASAVTADAAPELRSLADLATRHASGSISDAEILAQLEEYCREHPEVFAAWRLRYSIQMELGDGPAAIETTLAAAKAMPTDPRPLRQAIDLLGAAGRFDEAIAQAGKLADLTHPDTFEADVLIGRIEALRGNAREALNRLAIHRPRLLAESTAGPTAGLTAYLAALAAAGQADEADRLLAPHATDPAWAGALLQASDALPADLLETRRKWLTLAESEATALRCAERWNRVGKLSGDATDAARALGLADSFGSADNPEWRWVTAEADGLLGRFEEAEAGYRALIAAYPDIIAPYVSLSALLAAQPARAADAVAFAAESAERFGPADGPNRIAIAWIDFARGQALAGLGRSDEAEAVFRGVLDRVTDHAGALIWLARLRADAGDLDAARDLMRRSPAPERLDATLRAVHAEVTARLS
jgi:predicted Zn-dependent protease